MATVRREAGPGAAAFKIAVAQLDTKVGKVGWLGGQVYPGTSIPVALVAAVQEYGWPQHNIPARLTIRATAEALQSVWAEEWQRAAKQMINGQISVDQMFERVGAKITGDLRKHIAEIRTPPLLVATVEARLRGKKQGKVVSLTASKPEIDSGLLYQSLTHITEAAE